MNKEEIIKEFREKLRYLDEAHGYCPDDVIWLERCLDKLLEAQRKDLLEKIEKIFEYRTEYSEGISWQIIIKRIKEDIKQLLK